MLSVETVLSESYGDAQLYEDRHRHWTEAHECRLVQNKLKKAAEDELFERKMIESTAQYRAQMRMLKETRERLQVEAKKVMPIVMLCAFSQKMFAELLHHWEIERLHIRFRGIVRFWRKQRSSRNANSYAALVLINWLHKNVAVKSVAFRVFRGIRTYLRRVKTLQQMWRVKSARRQLNFLILQRAWIEKETLLVDAATEEYERRLVRVSELYGLLH
jgi:hypothetical protein